MSIAIAVIIGFFQIIGWILAVLGYIGLCISIGSGFWFGIVLYAYALEDYFKSKTKDFRITAFSLFMSIWVCFCGIFIFVPPNPKPLGQTLFLSFCLGAIWALKESLPTENKKTTAGPPRWDVN